MTPNEAHKDEHHVEVKANSVMKEKYLRNHPNIKKVIWLKFIQKMVVIIPVEKKRGANGAKKHMKLKKLREITIE